MHQITIQDKKEQITDTCDNVDKSHEHHAKRKEKRLTSYRQCNSNYLPSGKGKPKGAENRLVVGGPEGGGLEVVTTKGHGGIFVLIKMFIILIVVVG